MSFTVYRSSAGSGKTFTLVKAYLAIALGTPQAEAYRNILAITFTNKAANEMKERVISALKALSADASLDGSNATLLDLLTQEIGEPEEVLRERAKATLEHLLHHYSDFAVSTIDKFVHRVVRTFANDLRIPYNFEVELDASNLLSKAIDLLISRIGDDEQLTRALVDFTESKADDEKSWHIEADLYKFAFNLLSEDGHKHLKKIRQASLEDFSHLRILLQEKLKGMEQTVKEIGKTGMDLVTAEGLTAKAFAGGARSGFPVYLGQLARGQMDKIEPSDTLKTNLEAGKWHGTKATSTEKAAIDRIRPTLEGLYRQMMDLLGTLGPTYHLYVLIHRNVYPLGVLNEIEKIIEAFKEENNLLHISEFNKKIATIVAEEPAPFIYERLGERYRHYLIDEFQDTSVLQWQNLLPLVENALASGHDNMIVGDGKQSIYRWRGGDVEQFERLPEIMGKEESAILADRERVLQQHFKEQPLRTNFRSRSHVVEFNNFFFARLAERLAPPYDGIYRDVAQEIRPGLEGGLVQVEVVDSEPEEEIEAMLQRIETTIQDCRNDGYALADITILCRRNAEASVIAEHLLSVGIDIISSESLMLAHSEKVGFLVGFIRYLSDPQNHAFQAELIIRSGSAQLTDSDLHPNLEQLRKEGTAFSFEAFFRTNGYPLDLGLLTRLPLYEAVEELIRLFGMNKEASPFLNFFLDFVYAYSARQNDNLGDFLEKWEEKKEKLSIVMPEGVEAVQIMTIHKSKGLEFPVVIFPFANWRVQNAKNDLWVELPEEELGLQSLLVPTNKLLEKTAFSDLYTEETAKSLLDNFNVFYVACTRPVDRLFLLTTEPNRYQNFSSYFLGFLKDAPEWNEELNRYQLGVSGPAPPQPDKTGPETLELGQLHSRDWREKISISLKAPDIWDPDQPGADEWYGLLQTALLNLRATGRLEATLKSMFLEGLLTEEEQQQLNKKVATLLEIPEVAPYFTDDAPVRFDVEILLPNGDTVQPDRLIIDGQKANLLKFITKQPNERDKRQLNWCSKLLMEMGYGPVNAFFLDLTSGRLNRIDGNPQLELF